MFSLAPCILVGKLFSALFTKEKGSIIKDCFEAQLENPIRNDWTETVKADLEMLKIDKVWMRSKE